MILGTEGFGTVMLLRRVGGKGVELLLVEGEEHCFQIYHPQTENSKGVISRIAAFLV